MVYIKWTFGAILALAVFAFLHYNLPQRDIVRVAGIETKRVDLGENFWFFGSPDAGNAALGNRDVFFIQTIRQNGKPMVYRNEDTSWGWPPYFKFDTSNLQTEAADLVSTKDNPQWVVVRHYGWRNEFLSIYPNAVAVWPVDGPDVRLIPYFNIVVLTLLGSLFVFIWVRIRRFKANRIDPMLDDVGDALDSAGDQVVDTASGVGGWFKRLFRRWFG